MVEINNYRPDPIVRAGTGHTFGYQYLADSNLIASLSVDSGHPFSVTRSYEPNRDVLTAIDTKWSTASRTRFDYSTNALMQRVSRTQSGDVFSDYGVPSTFQAYGYDGRGELTSASSYLGTSADAAQKLQDRQHEYGYDNIGNRQWSNQTGDSTLRDNYTTSPANEYVTKENNTVTISGTADPAASVAVAGRTTGAARRGAYWSDTSTVNNVQGPWSGAKTVYAAKSGAGPSGTDLVRADVRMAQAAAQLQNFVYDKDGNLTNDGIWGYTWDAENRLVAMTSSTAAVTAGFPNRVLQFRYDYLGRRVQKLVYDGGTNQLITGRRFVYNGWSIIAEYGDSGGPTIGAILRSYTWGLDIARTFADAGGVGALVQIVDHGAKRTYFPSYDGNGNIVAVFNADTGAVGAAYEYSPYGETLRADVLDPVLASQPFRFSTKWLDQETGYYDYGHRFYDPKVGRFVGRDPIEEKGGINLYGFCCNDGVNRWDILGNDPDRAYYEASFGGAAAFQAHLDQFNNGSFEAFQGFMAEMARGEADAFKGGGQNSSSPDEWGQEAYAFDQGYNENTWVQSTTMADPSVAAIGRDIIGTDYGAKKVSALNPGHALAGNPYVVDGPQSKGKSANVAPNNSATPPLIVHAGVSLGGTVVLPALGIFGQGVHLEVNVGLAINWNDLLDTHIEITAAGAYMPLTVGVAIYGGPGFYGSTDASAPKPGAAWNPATVHFEAGAGGPGISNTPVISGSFDFDPKTGFPSGSFPGPLPHSVGRLGAGDAIYAGLGGAKSGTVTLPSLRDLPVISVGGVSIVNPLFGPTGP